MRTGVALSNIKRVVSVFILRQRSNIDETQVALFRRCSSMPSFPNHWAAISGSIEKHDASPFAAAVREIGEETNLGELLGEYTHLITRGLHVDVPKDETKGVFGGRVIRVYPFALRLPEDYEALWSKIEMRGTEHDQMKFQTISDLLDMKEPCVPSLVRAFHHATYGNYLNLPLDIKEWEKDRVNGAAHLARQAMELASAHHSQNKVHQLDGDLSIPQQIAMLRPSMVPIVNVMNEFYRQTTLLSKDVEHIKKELLYSLTYEGDRCIELGCEMLMSMMHERNSTFVVGTFSRSSTLKIILQRIIEKTSSQLSVICSESTPGDEGRLMATDIPGACCLPDEEFKQQIIDGKIDMVIVGADCILLEGNGVVNKVGTAELAAVCKRANVPIVSFADRWKIWEDCYCPPLEDIFELIPSDSFDHVVVPGGAYEDNL
jgi:translation initiation factor 2B subunit (eIF-2B alpha/beta/delta family)/8-oxo-dGTP pyrophosphatase MutT (NUDIX family)